MAVFIITGGAIFAAGYLTFLWQVRHDVITSPLALVVFSVRTGIELLACLYGLFFVFVAIGCFRHRVPKRSPIDLRRTDCPPVGVIYLCCNDLDRRALRSLGTLAYPGPLHIIIHDDAVDAAAQQEVDAAAALLRSQTDAEVQVLRRPDKSGGKPGAVNYVLERTGDLYEYFLLCDNDSTVTDPELIQRALPWFEDESAAVVQCRSVARRDGDYCRINRLLSNAVDAFDAFLSVYAAYGWRPFIGHNALLRTEAVRAVGGMTPGFFSDDLDLTVRLNTAGWQVVYAPHLELAERHPPNFAAFRKRCYKWAYGCGQVLCRHAGNVLTTPRMSWPEKLSFFMFCGFYMGQTLLLLYLTLTFIVAPLVGGALEVDPWVGLIAGTAIIAVIFLPTAAYLLRERAPLKAWGAVPLCGLVYGTTDFACGRGLLDCIGGRKRTWTPTNIVRGRAGAAAPSGEMLFGMAMVLVPLWWMPSLLYLPCAFLFAGKFLFSPAMAVLYDDRRATPRSVPASQEVTPASASPVRPSASAFRAGLIAALLVCGVLATPAMAADGPVAPVEIQGRDILVDGEPFLIKGIHYGPWRPGTGPNKDHPYPGPELIEEDLELIAALGANTIVVFDPPGYVLDLAHEHDLKVFYCFAINWYAIGSEEFEQDKRDILERVERFRDKPAVIGWVLGNEIPVHAVSHRGEEPFEQGLRSLYDAAKQVDPHRPITHANWPPLRGLALYFFDIISFNLYPAWPPEVALQGFGNYLVNELKPRAGDKPLLITEFGTNTIEAGEQGQARIVRECWDAIVDAQIAGGIVFAFADEWWKNYDRPKAPGQWWHRVPDPDAEQQHDLDPEEHYGIMTAEREPKPAYAVVQEMFRDTEQPASGSESRVAVTAASAGLIVLALGLWGWARYRTPARREVGERMNSHLN